MQVRLILNIHLRVVSSCMIYHFEVGYYHQRLAQPAHAHTMNLNFITGCLIIFQFYWETFWSPASMGFWILYCANILVCHIVFRHIHTHVRWNLACISQPSLICDTSTCNVTSFSYSEAVLKISIARPCQSGRCQSSFCFIVKYGVLLYFVFDSFIYFKTSY